MSNPSHLSGTKGRGRGATRKPIIIDPTFELVTDQLNAFNISSPGTESLNSSSSSNIAMVGRGRGRQINSPSGPGVRVRGRGRGRGNPCKSPNNQFSSSDVSSDIPTNSGSGDLVSGQPSDEKLGLALRAPRNNQEPINAIPSHFEPNHSAKASQSSDGQPRPSQSSNPTGYQETLEVVLADKLQSIMFEACKYSDFDGVLSEEAGDLKAILRRHFRNMFPNYSEKDADHFLSLNPDWVWQCAEFNLLTNKLDRHLDKLNKLGIYRLRTKPLQPEQRTKEQLQWLEGMYRITDQEFLELDAETANEYYRLADVNDENFGLPEEDVQQWNKQYPSGKDENGLTLEQYYYFEDWFGERLSFGPPPLSRFSESGAFAWDRYDLN